MNTLTTLAVVIGLLGSALIGGVFFAFSSFVMGALGRLSSDAGIEAMQSINVVVINRSVLGAFMGTAVLCLGLVIVAMNGWGGQWAPLVVAGSLFYIVGTFIVTMVGNVPLNNRLAEVLAGDRDADAVWALYLERWTRLNSLRAAAAMTSTLLFALALMNGG